MTKIDHLRPYILSIITIFYKIINYPWMMRNGVLGALMDEYERALDEFISIASTVDNDQFVARWTSSGRFSAIQDILHHTCRAGYAYADNIRSVRDITQTSPSKWVEGVDAIEKDHREMFDYTLASVEGLYDLSETEICAIEIPVWGDEVYNLEQLLEHAIVHILRHRRQIEKILSGIYN